MPVTAVILMVDRCHVLLWPGGGGRCDHGTVAGCRSSLLLLRLRVHGPPMISDCQQNHELSGTPRTPTEAVPGNTWSPGWAGVHPGEAAFHRWWLSAIDSASFLVLDTPARTGSCWTSSRSWCWHPQLRATPGSCEGHMTAGRDWTSVSECDCWPQVCALTNHNETGGAAKKLRPLDGVTAGSLSSGEVVTSDLWGVSGSFAHQVPCCCQSGR